MPNIGPMELVVVLIIALVIFGPKKLPELGKGLGQGMREFKNSINGADRAELTQGPPTRPASEETSQSSASDKPIVPGTHRS